MGSFGGFYKGDKKKKKKDDKNTGSGSISTAPIFSLPKMVEKKKKEK